MLIDDLRDRNSSSGGLIPDHQVALENDGLIGEHPDDDEEAYVVADAHKLVLLLQEAFVPIFIGGCLVAEHCQSGEAEWSECGAKEPPRGSLLGLNQEKTRQHPQGGGYREHSEKRRNLQGVKKMVVDHIVRMAGRNFGIDETEDQSAQHEDDGNH